MSLVPAPPRLLLVEDDAVSRQFLVDALTGMPAQVDAAASIAHAVELASRQDHALWLIDAHLPDGDGIACLRALRQLRSSTTALAITAGTSREMLDGLCAAGFVEVLLKPVSIALLRGTVARLIDGGPAATPTKAAPGKMPVWDREAALAAIGGNEQSLMALRRMFLDELPALRAQLERAQAGGDVTGVAGIVHKLKASCRFVGAARIAAAIDQLEAQPLDPGALDRLRFAMDDAKDWKETGPET